MKRKSFSYTRIRDAFDYVGAGGRLEQEAYLCLETGETHLHTEIGDNFEELPEDVGDPDKYLAIPHRNDFDLGRRLALHFAREHLPAEAFDTARACFNRAGAYDRFKNLLDARGLLQQWYDYEEAAIDEALRGWCEESGIVLED